MKFSRPCALGSGLLGVLGLSAVLAQTGEPARTPQVLDPSTVSVRLLLGVGDRKSETWSGRVRVDMGEVVGLQAGGSGRGIA